MLSLALYITLACFGLALCLNAVQMFRAPTIADRILVLDTLTINAIAVLILYDTLAGSSINFQAVLLFAMVGFVSSVAFCKYLLRGSIIE